MAFETSVSLPNCDYTYAIHPNIKKYTLRDNTFAQTKVGNYELNRLQKLFQIVEMALS